MVILAVLAAFQPTLPARGATQHEMEGYHNEQYFNPRSPHGERQVLEQTREIKVTAFQPTLPARGATFPLPLARARATHFNPRSPHGERRCGRCTLLLLRGISTHAPRTGSDRKGQENDRHTTDFNPRSPHGERPTFALQNRALFVHFNPRSPHGERHGRRRTSAAAKDFNPRSPHGERLIL